VDLTRQHKNQAGTVIAGAEITIQAVRSLS
jgi:hypothetical protein